MSDPVNKPKHYNFGKYEVIDVIEDWRLGYHLGNAVKYIARCEHKDNKLQDLKKARWYLEREIERLEGKAVQLELPLAQPNKPPVPRIKLYQRRHNAPESEAPLNWGTFAEVAREGGWSCTEPCEGCGVSEWVAQHYVAQHYDEEVE